MVLLGGKDKAGHGCHVKGVQMQKDIIKTIFKPSTAKVST